ncbi:FAD/NAD(P)-binding protein [Georgenia sp. MJ173]|uniref:FAD/NAD(P)-binding protein n=1 Tax=Georgenia sunbinii TaxID=3117728 RepID=UPI002F269127
MTTDTAGTEASSATTMLSIIATDDLAQTVRGEIEEFDYPAHSWPVQHQDAGQKVLDVLIVGAGQAGLTAAIRLHREGIRNIEVVDAAEPGREGPWVTWARMETLRTVKTLHGPESGIRSASFRSWYEHRFGADAYAAMELIPRETWGEYLGWLRQATGIVVTNGTVVTTIRPHGRRWLAELHGPDGARTVVARKILACTGIDGVGGGAAPGAIEALPAGSWAHSSDMIDLEAVRGRTVAVVGVGASAFDNAAAALEAGAAKVIQLGRRATLPTLNSLRHLESKGIFRHFSALSDDTRLAFKRAELALAMPAPTHSVDRCRRHENYSLLLDAGIDGAAADAGGVTLHTAQGDVAVDFVIAATGFRVDLHRVSWLAEVADRILLWGDRHDLTRDTIDRHLGGCPYLGPGASVQPRDEADVALPNLHLMNAAAQVSFGPVAIGINGLPWFSDNVVHTIARDLLVEDGADLLAAFVEQTSTDALAATR